MPYCQQATCRVKGTSPSGVSLNPHSKWLCEAGSFSSSVFVNEKMETGKALVSSPPTPQAPQKPFRLRFWEADSDGTSRREVRP